MTEDDEKELSAIFVAAMRLRKRDKDIAEIAKWFREDQARQRLRELSAKVPHGFRPRPVCRQPPLAVKPADLRFLVGEDVPAVRNDVSDIELAQFEKEFADVH